MFLPIEIFKVPTIKVTKKIGISLRQKVKSLLKNENKAKMERNQKQDLLFFEEEIGCIFINKVSIENNFYLKQTSSPHTYCSLQNPTGCKALVRVQASFAIPPLRQWL